MDYYKIKLELLRDINEHGRTSGITEITDRVFKCKYYGLKVVNKFIDYGFATTYKVGPKVYSKLTFKGEKILEALNKLDKVMNGQST